METAILITLILILLAILGVGWLVRNDLEMSQIRGEKYFKEEGE